MAWKNKALQLAVLMSLSITGAWAAPIQQVDVNIQSSTGEIPSILKKRMEVSVKAAAEHIFVGKETSQIQTQQAAYNKVTVDIINRLLYGYTVEGLDFQVANQSKINLLLKPYGDVVEHVDVAVDYGNLRPAVQDYIKEDLQGLKPRIEQILLGAPLDSQEWAGKLAQRTIRDDLEGVLPEFIPQVEVNAGKTAHVKVYLIPQGRIMRKGSTSIVSNTLPNVFFYNVKRKYDAFLQDFEGVPIEFISRHEREIEAKIQDQLNASTMDRRFGMKMNSDLEVGTETELLIHVDSSKYILRGEGYLDLGRQDDNVGFKVYTGVHRGKEDLYVQTDFYPNSYTWKFWLSYAYNVTKDTKLGYQYNLKNHGSRLWIDETIGPRWHVGVMRDFKYKYNEFTLGYDVHHYLTLQYIINNNENWLRLVGHI